MNVKERVRQEDEAARRMYYEIAGQEEQGLLERIKRDAYDRPFIYAGIAFGTLSLGKMIWGIRNRPKGMKLSVYIIHTRMAMQGAVVGTLVLGMCHQIMSKLQAMK